MYICCPLLFPISLLIHLRSLLIPRIPPPQPRFKTSQFQTKHQRRASLPNSESLKIANLASYTSALHTPPHEQSHHFYPFTSEFTFSIYSYRYHCLRGIRILTISVCIFIRCTPDFRVVNCPFRPQGGIAALEGGTPREQRGSRRARREHRGSRGEHGGEQGGSRAKRAGGAQREEPVLAHRTRSDATQRSPNWLPRRQKLMKRRIQADLHLS